MVSIRKQRRQLEKPLDQLRAGKRFSFDHDLQDEPSRLHEAAPPREQRGPLDAAEDSVSIDWDHYAQSRLNDFQRR